MGRIARGDRTLLRLTLAITLVFTGCATAPDRDGSEGDGGLAGTAGSPSGASGDSPSAAASSPDGDGVAGNAPERRVERGGGDALAGLELGRGGDALAGFERVGEAWVADAYPEDYDLDSLAVWPDDTGSGAWLIVTAKQAHRLVVHDAATGEPLREVGEEGDGPGQFRRPNGIAVVDDLVVVVERDNARVQVLSLPELEPLGTFGEGVLRRPYGIVAFPGADDEPPAASGEPRTAPAPDRRGPGQGTWALWITDNYETPDEGIPPPGELGGRLRHFRMRVEDRELQAELVASHGDTGGPGILEKVETIQADPAHGRLLVVEEEPPSMGIRVYDLEGRYTGTTVGEGIFEFEPEGIALWACGDGGYWVTTDQEDATSRFHVFDRVTFEHLGGFVGAATGTTDGVTLTQLALPGFPDGAFYASNMDVRFSAFGWGDIAAALGLESACR